MHSKIPNSHLQCSHQRKKMTIKTHMKREAQRERENNREDVPSWKSFWPWQNLLWKQISAIKSKHYNTKTNSSESENKTNQTGGRNQKKNHLGGDCRSKRIASEIGEEIEKPRGQQMKIVYIWIYVGKGERGKRKFWFPTRTRNGNQNSESVGLKESMSHGPTL